MGNAASEVESADELIVFTVTFYKSCDEVRFRECCAMLRHARTHGVRVVVVDASPDPAIRAAMRDAGAHAVREQTAKGKKGAAMREALGVAAEVADTLARPAAADRSAGDALLCWQEPEKADMPRHWRDVLRAANRARADVIVPTRDTDLFQRTYPIEQFHSESFANLYLDCAARAHGFATPLDWHFGPFALRRRHADVWLAHAGAMWDAQVVPIVHAVRAGLVVGACEVPFEAPRAMKEEEEGDLAFIEKRLMQINFLDPKVIAAWTEDRTAQ